MDRNRLLLIAAVVGLALAAPYLIPEEPKAKPAATEKAPPSAAPAAPKTTQAKELGAGDEAARRQAERTAVLENADFVAKVTSRNGGLVSFRLKGGRFHTEKQGLDIVTTKRERYLPLGVDIEGWPKDAALQLDVVSAEPEQVVLGATDDGLRVTRKIHTGKGAYALWITTHVENLGSTPRRVRLRLGTHHYVSRDDEGSNIPLLPVRTSHTSSGLSHHGGDFERLDRSALLTPHRFGPPVEFCAVENVYFLNAVAPEGKDAIEGCVLGASDWFDDATREEHGSLISASMVYAPLELPAGGEHTFQALAYLGPKSPDALAAAGHTLKDAIDTGWFTSLAEGLTWLLRVLFDTVGNWGVAIILLTFIVKLVLLPLTWRQIQSMARMKELKPELDRINALYGDDREKKGAAIMDLYRKRGVNPMAGCFPVLLQLPIWFSLYTSLSSNVELYHAPFALWWTDLSSPDPLFFLPVALGVLMFVQQKMTPAAGMDPVQQKMMLYMMPTMMTSFMLFLPAGLCLYMFTNSALSIGQQRLIEAHLKPSSSPEGAALPENTPSPSQQPEESVPASTSQLRPRSARPSKAERRWRRGKR